MNTTEKNDTIFIKIMHIYDAGDMEFIKSILYANNIEHYMQGRICYNVSSMYEPQPIKLWVDKTQLQNAKEILENLDLKGASLAEEFLQYLREHTCPKCKSEITDNIDKYPICNDELYECDNCKSLLSESDEYCPGCGLIL